MKYKPVIAIVAATIWISVSEFFRNEVLLKSYWSDHYESLGLIFPSEPINGMVWGIWSLLFAVGIFVLARDYSLIKTTVVSWFFAFVLMWIVTGNMNVLPFGILIFAIPLSLLETFVAAFMIKKICKTDS